MARPRAMMLSTAGAWIRSLASFTRSRSGDNKVWTSNRARSFCGVTSLSATSLIWAGMSENKTGVRRAGLGEASSGGIERVMASIDVADS